MQKYSFLCKTTKFSRLVNSKPLIRGGGRGNLVKYKEMTKLFTIEIKIKLISNFDGRFSLAPKAVSTQF